MFRFGLTIAILYLVAPGWLRAEAMNSRVALNGDCSVQFATAEQAREHLQQRDAYLNAVGKFDREIRLQRQGVRTEDHIAFIGQQVLDWKADAQQRLAEVIGRVREKLAPFKLPLPDTIWLIRTTGNEESGAAYCRRNAVILPERMDQLAPEQLERLMLHELFHVLSNQNPDLRRCMYSIIGFDVIEPVKLPEQLLDRKITNPDAPEVDCYLWVAHEGQHVAAGPVLISKADFADGEKRSMFQLLTFSLVVLDLAPDRKTASVHLENGKPILLPPDQTAFYWNIGMNTGYIIHPDEILADNFVHLMRGETNLPTPRIVRELDRVLRGFTPVSQ